MEGALPRHRAPRGAPSDSPERHLAVALARGFVTGVVPDRAASADVDEDRMIGLLLAQRLLVALGARMVSAESIETTNAFADRVETARRTARFRGMLQQAAAERAAAALHDVGIPVVALKGASLADRLFGDIGAREAADIDLLVGTDQIGAGVATLRALGWDTIPEDWEGPGLPGLHYRLHHETLPVIEMHWRVHWYETSLAGEALGRTASQNSPLLSLAPDDELVFLLLFVARDGFCGLRQVLDIAAWLATYPRRDPSTAVDAAAASHPSLGPALRTAARHAERVLGLERGRLGSPARPAPAEAAALRLANVWYEGSAQQIAAEVSMVDALLTPRSGRRAFVTRQVVPSHRPGRFAHAARLSARYVLAFPRLFRRHG